MASLATTNALLGILVTLSVIEALAFIALIAGGVVFTRRVHRTLEAIKSEHIAPAASRLNAILDDVNDVTSSVKGNMHAFGRIVRMATRWASAGCHRPEAYTNTENEEVHHA